MKSFLEYLYEAKNVNTAIIDKIIADKTYDMIAIATGKSTFKILVPFNDRPHRMQVMQYLANTYNGQIVGNDGGKTGKVIFPDYNVSIEVKPKEKQGTHSDGVDSEYALTDKVNELISMSSNGSINLIFKSRDSHGTKQFKCTAITQAEQYGRNAASIKGRTIKADVVFHAKNGKTYNISLKKKGAAWVENGSYYGHDWYVQTIENAVVDNKTQLIGNDKTGYKLSKTIYWDMTADEKKHALFGDDCIYPHGCVIEATFDKTISIEQLDIDTYLIDVDYIMTSTKDAIGKHDLAWFAINHAGRPGHWPGIYVRAAFMSRANSNTVYVKRV